MLIGVSLILAACSTSYAFINNYRVMLAVVVVHGLFWSGLLSASSAYMMSTLPEHRRAEGLGYWGMASVSAIAIAPALGFWVYHHGWNVLCLEIAGLNLIMATIAWRLPDDHVHASNPPNLKNPSNPLNLKNLVEWRVVWLSITLALVAFGYGGLTRVSSLFADALGVTPRSLFLTGMAAAILVARLTLGRMLDQLGHRRVFLWVIVTPACGLLVLSLARGWMTLLLAGVVFGGGFGLMYPAYAAYVMRHVAANRRGAAFGAIIAAFDTGVGTGSCAMGGLIRRFGFPAGFAAAAGHDRRG